MASSCIIGRVAMAAMLLAIPPVHADTTLVVQGSDGLKSMIQVKNGKGKMSAAGVDEYIIFDAGAGTIAYVEPRQRRYMLASEAMLAANVQTARDIQNTIAPYMTDMLASLSPEQRRLIRERMGSVLGPPAAGRAAADDLRAVARGTHTVAGLRCEASGIVKHGRPAAEVCMATAASGRLSKRDFATLETMVTFSRGIASSASGMLGDLAEQFEFLATDIDGVPIAVHDLEHGKSYQVTTVSDSALPDALFNGYAQFERREMPDLSYQ